MRNHFSFHRRQLHDSPNPLRRVEVVCHCCGATDGTDEMIERLSSNMNTSTDEIHKALWSGYQLDNRFFWEWEGHLMVMEGCYARRVNR